MLGDDYYAEKAEPLDPARLPKVRKKFRKVFHCDPPAGYLEVLALWDGLEYNSLRIFGSRTTRTQHPVESFKAINRDLKMDWDGSDPEWKVLAFWNESYLAHHTPTDRWGIVDEACLEEYELESEEGGWDPDRILETMLAHALGIFEDEEEPDSTPAADA